MRVALNRVFCARRIDDIERRVCVCVCESVAGTIFCASQDSNLQKLYAIQFLRFYLHQFRFCFIVSLTFFRNRFGFFKMQQHVGRIQFLTKREKRCTRPLLPPDS